MPHNKPDASSRQMEPSGILRSLTGRQGKGFLICAKNQSGQVVKKLHLGVASSGYGPCPHRAPTLGGDWLGGEFSTLRKVAVLVRPGLQPRHPQAQVAKGCACNRGR